MSARVSGDDGFGAYLASVHERDIDLLIMEEFHASVEFTRWFAAQAGVCDAEFDGAWHSVTDSDGETDLLLRVRSGTQRVAILIENKVGAAEQTRQDERYHLRAARAQNEGRFDEFTTCICAPQLYLDGLPAASLYQERVPYEAIAAWFDAQNDPRSRWRKTIINEAIAQGRRGYKMIVNERVSAFFLDFWKYLQSNHPKLVMRRPTPKGNKSNWILFKGAGFERNVGFHIKLDQCVVELGFNGRRVEDLSALAVDWPDDVYMVQKGGTAALALNIPELDQTRPLREQTQSLIQVMAAVERLVPYAHVLDRTRS